MNRDTKTPTDDELRIFIAERVLPVELMNNVRRAAEVWNSWPAAFDFLCLNKGIFTDYPSDLNACAAMEKVLTPAQCYDYQQKLCDLFGEWTPHSTAKNWIWHATARQRALAFFRTLQ